MYDNEILDNLVEEFKRACEDCNSESIRNSLTKISNVNQILDINNGWNAIHILLKSNHFQKSNLEDLKLLLKSGVDPYKKSLQGVTSFELACHRVKFSSQIHLEAAKILAEEIKSFSKNDFAKVNKTIKNFPEDIKSTKNYAELLDIVKRKEKTVLDSYPVHTALKNKNITQVIDSLYAGYDVNAISSEGKTLLDIAVDIFSVTDFDMVDFLKNTFQAKTAPEMLGKIDSNYSITQYPIQKNKRKNSEIDVDVANKILTPAVEKPLPLIPKKNEPYSTWGDGNCAFHALFGEWDISKKAYFCENAATFRERFSEKIKEYIFHESGNINNEEKNIKCNLEEAIKNHIFDPDSPCNGENFKNARNAYKAYCDSIENEITGLRKVLWQKISENTDVKQALELFFKAQGKNTNDEIKIFDFFNENKNEEEVENFKALILSLPEINDLYLKINNLSQQPYSWDKVFSNQEIINEYALHMQIQTSHIEPAEISMMAYLFDKKVLFYTAGTEPITYNQMAKNAVSVSYTGDNHYERIAESPEFLNDSQKAFKLSKPSIEIENHQKLPIMSEALITQTTPIQSSQSFVFLPQSTASCVNIKIEKDEGPCSGR